MGYVVTDHAIERYIERVEPGLGPNGAKLKIQKYLKESVPLRGPTVEMMKRWKTSNRNNQYLIHEKSGAVLVIHRQSKRSLVVTVLRFKDVLKSAHLAIKKARQSVTE